MRTVHKVALSMGAETQQVQLPADAAIRRVAAQHGGIALWYETDTESPGVLIHHMRIIGTGDRVPDGWVYLGTVELGAFVFHVFEARIPGVTYSAPNIGGRRLT